MPQFKLKPVMVDAIQWHPGDAIEGVITDPLALIGKSWAHIGHQRELDGKCGIMETELGPMFVRPGDWIITEADGSKRPCGQRFFQRTYELVEE